MEIAGVINTDKYTAIYTDALTINTKRNKKIVTNKNKKIDSNILKLTHYHIIINNRHAIKYNKKFYGFFLI